MGTIDKLPGEAATVCALCVRARARAFKATKHSGETIYLEAN